MVLGSQLLDNPLVGMALYSGTIFAFFFVALFGGTSRIRLVRVLHKFLTGGCCSMFGRFRKRFVPTACNNFCDSAENYLCHSAHPLLQFFYLALVWGGVFVFYQEAMQIVLKDPQSSPVHAYTVPVAIFLPNFFFLLCNRLDPGVITKDTYHRFENNYPMDGVIFFEKHCETCDVPRPARSKHCSLCKRCVARFDHHCAWVNNCIGAGNVRFFLAFLFSTASLCLYGAFLIMNCAVYIVNERQLFSLHYRNEYGEVVPVGWDMVIKYLLAYHASTMSLGVFMLIISFVLYGFFSYHVFLVVRNTTTSETFKWSDARRELRYLKRKQELAREGELVPSDAPATASGSKKKGGRRRAVAAAQKNERENSGMTTAEIKELLAMDLPESVTNIYNKGIIANFSEVFFPAFHRVPRRAPKRARQAAETNTQASGDSGASGKKEGKGKGKSKK